MAEKAKAKKASKALAKKSASLRPKKKEISVKDAYHEADAEELQLAQEETPKRGAKTKAVAAEKKSVAEEKESKREKDDKLTKAAAPEIISPIQPRVVVNKASEVAPEAKAEKPTHEHRDRQRSEAPRHEAKSHSHSQTHSNQQQTKAASGDGLRVRLSESLVKKLKEQAADEGISLEEFIAELLAESVVLRAWEIVERKNAMKGHSGQGQGSMGGGQNRNYNQNQGNKGNNQRGGGGNQGGGGNKGHRGMSHVRYQSIMDDKATFLEYVRNQEKARR